MILAPAPEAYARAAKALREGGVVAHPTETVYGLAADPFSESALRRLFEIKGRPDTNPVLVIIAGPAQLDGLAAEVSDDAARLMAAFWPGPLSLLLPRAARVPDLLTAGTASICVRCPAHAIARAICAAFGGAITSTSANRSGDAPAIAVAGAMLPGVALGIDAGELSPAQPSTIYDPATGKILRQGPVTREQIEAALNHPPRESA